jgi:hypothetical protein
MEGGLMLLQTSEHLFLGVCFPRRCRIWSRKSWTVFAVRYMLYPRILHSL